MSLKPIVLLIRDGWGQCAPSKYNAVTNARTPNMTCYWDKYPRALLDASGRAVGLPDGYQGSSEVGHLNMGAGRIVEQELKKIKDLIESGKLFTAPAFKNAIDNCLAKNSALHLIGLVQDEGVHAHQDHLFAIAAHAAKRGVKKLWVHFFSDGRDTPPRSAVGFVRETESQLKAIGLGKIGTVIGRYYAMDRSENWELTDMSYRAIVSCEGIKVKTAEEAITRAYNSDKNPDGTPLVDEYVPPSVVEGYAGLKAGDSVIHINFRQDRAIQLTKAFVENDYPGKRGPKPDITFCGLTRYYDSFPFNALPPMDEDAGMSNLLGEVLSKNGKRQLRIAETQKFKHVTSFFNGKMLKPYQGEDRIEIKGTFDPATFAEHPQMNAPEVTERVVKEIASGKYDFILVNFANCDMVGHTGCYESAVKAVEMVDSCAGKVVDAALKAGGAVLVTSDHGNAEEMWDQRLEIAKTSHTKNLVSFQIISGDSPRKLRATGILSDIAPTVLELMGIAKPAEMTSASLIAR